VTAGSGHPRGEESRDLVSVGPRQRDWPRDLNHNNCLIFGYTWGRKGRGSGCNVQLRDVQVRDVQVRDVQVRDVQVRDVQVRDVCCLRLREQV
jgi:hypothetical protein